MKVTQTVSQALAEWVVGASYEKFPSVIRGEARKTFINSLGTAIGAYELPDVQRAIAYVESQRTSGPSTVLVGGAKVIPSAACFVNGVMFNNLGQEETHMQSGTHPVETTMPVVLALAEQLGTSGKATLEALIIGAEVSMAVARMSLTPAVKYDRCEAPAVYGTIGAAAAASKLLGLDEVATSHALGLAANFAAGLSECIRTGTDEYHFIVAMASQHAELAARLASLGAIASPTCFEGDGGFYHLFGGVERDALHEHNVRDDVMSRLGHDWGLPELIYKPYPVNYFNEIFADGALVLRNRHQLLGTSIASVRITVGQLAATSGAMVPPPYVTRGGHLGSTRFCVASMLARGTLSLADTQDLGAPDIGAIMEVTEVIADPELMTAMIEVTTTQGDTYAFDGATEGREYTLGEDEIKDIFRQTAMVSLGEERTNELLDALTSVEMESDISHLMDLTIDARA